MVAHRGPSEEERESGVCEFGWEVEKRQGSDARGNYYRCWLVLAKGARQEIAEGGGEER